MCPHLLSTGSNTQSTYPEHVGFGDRVEITQLGAGLLGGELLIVETNGRKARVGRLLVEVESVCQRHHSVDASSREPAR